MSQLTADTSRKYKLEPDRHTEQPVDAAIQIFMNSMVGKNPTTNLARQLVGGDDFLGFAFAPAWNIANPYSPNLSVNGVLVGAAGAINVEVRTEGCVFIPLASLAGATGQPNIEAPVYASDGNTFTLGGQAQTLTEGGTPTGGTFVLSAGGTAGSAIAFNATGAGVQAGLPSTISSLVSSVTGVASGPWTVNWNPGVTPIAITVSTNSLTGGTSPAVTVGAAATQSGLSKIGTVRSYLWGQFEILFKALTDKVS